ncbi:TraB/GumN family protein [Psychrobium sp. 1_MG-2023]|uniref:TraB/GumN family protein n=1 Tax=Psychrobium sp. 1_MG-2023 TaxID=3062624 RepID=UPI000C321489|nr:TraB/GumN family protein [Psychrobium sp. 1_MG-2023]MDP2561314.1 TraB/GumN family protein [Psychrobium sp. 1_MG-2023]PKF54129.1 TraB/GumN family protein [Alteromonadales bacterium alter-6D02]
MKPTKLMKSISAVAVLLSSVIGTNVQAQTSVWKVSNNQHELFVAGTVHILPSSQFPLPEEFGQAYQQADSIVLEAKLPDPSDREAQMAMIQKLAYPTGKKLDQVISPSTYKELANYLTEFGVNLDELNGFKPGFIISMMTVMAAQKEQLAGEGVDAYFDKLAKQDNKPIDYLETTEFQLNMLANMGQGFEDKFLKQSLKEMVAFKPTMEKLFVAWRAGNMGAINEVILKDAMEQEPKHYKALFTDRNHNWIPKIETMLQDADKELVLVGAGHLAGKDSVLTLLKDKGYTVTQL